MPAALRRRIERYYAFQYGALQQNDEGNVLVGLPRSLELQLDLTLTLALALALALTL